MDEAITFRIFEDDIILSLEELETIKEKLLVTLKQQQPPDDFSHLILDTENATPMIYNSIARIGSWRMLNRDNNLLLERQQFPRVPLMLFYEAPLILHDGQWQVLSINVKTVRGH